VEEGDYGGFGYSTIIWVLSRRGLC